MTKIYLPLLLLLVLTACAAPTAVPASATLSPAPTETLTPSPTVTPTATPVPTATHIPTPTVPAWAKEMVEGVHNLVNEGYGVGPDGSILKVAENETVAEFEATHMWVPEDQQEAVAEFEETHMWFEDESGGRFITEEEAQDLGVEFKSLAEGKADNVNKKLFMTQVEAEALGIEFKSLAPDASAVEIVDKESYEVVGSELQYEGVTVGRFEGEELVFTAPDGSEVRVKQENLRWDYILTDDGVNLAGKLDNQRVVARLEVVEKAPEGLEGEWVKWVYQEGEWHRVPAPEKMVALWQGLEEGKSVNDKMAEFREDLPEDWQDLPELDEAVVDVYLAQQAQVWEQVKKMIEKMDNQDLGMLVAGGFQDDGLDMQELGRTAEFYFRSVGGENGWGIVSGIKVGDQIVLSLPTKISMRNGSGDYYWVLFNYMLDPTMNDELFVSPEKNRNWAPFQSVWDKIRSGENVYVKANMITTYYNSTKYKWVEEVVERNNDLVPRGVVNKNKEFMHYRPEWMTPYENVFRSLTLVGDRYHDARYFDKISGIVMSAVWLARP